MAKVTRPKSLVAIEATPRNHYDARATFRTNTSGLLHAAKYHVGGAKQRSWDYRPNDHRAPRQGDGVSPAAQIVALRAHIAKLYSEAESIKKDIDWLDTRRANDLYYAAKYTRQVNQLKRRVYLIKKAIAQVQLLASLV